MFRGEENFLTKVLFPAPHLSKTFSGIVFISPDKTIPTLFVIFLKFYSAVPELALRKRAEIRNITAAHTAKLLNTLHKTIPLLRR